MGSQNTHGGNIFLHAQQKGCTLQDILDFSANINPLGPSPEGLRSLKDHLDLICHYPDPHCREIKERISSYYHIPKEMILMGNGAVEILYLLAQYKKPKEVLIVGPTFSEYERASLAAGSNVRMVPLKKEENFTLTAAAIKEEIPYKGMVYLGNPNNPDGCLLNKEEGLQILKWVEERESILLIDESFMDFVTPEKDYTFLPYVKESNALVILHSLTKFFAIPGLRLGFAVLDSALVEALQGYKDPWNVNVLAQYYGYAALGDTTYIQKTKEYIKKEKERFFAKMNEIDGLCSYRPSVNFMLCEIQNQSCTAQELQEQLYDRHILVRNCAAYDGLSPYFFRVAIKKEEENNKLYEAIKAVLR